MPSCLAPHQAFLGLSRDASVSYAQSRAVVIPFGLEMSVSYGRGTAHGPRAILTASREVELFDEDLGEEPYRNIGIVTFPEPTVIASAQKAALSQLEALVETVVADHKFPLVLGGEHTLTVGAIRPLIARYSDLVILHFDAHADLRDQYQGNPYSHACALRRCLDYKPLHLVSIGIRNISKEEMDVLESNRERIDVYWAKDKPDWSLDAILKPLKGRPIYLTFDVDAFDLSLMPATGTPEPGGLFWDEVIAIIKAAARVGTIVAADINELSPKPDGAAYDFLVAKLAYKILSLSLIKD